ncbi:MAG: hypothetical protein A2010_06690 [Nitrospirae bacterium GWD2_57_9]|nr:MAG: hypothetical protein A2010_06690 [Nitrospirae bacterium GWD2_57_9]OGW45050.1 MAG: hypothetical protein A2078_10480 [Nitrospirae bacterium GWC2_57_9]
MKTVANILLGSWLVLTGLVRLGGIRFQGSEALLAALGIATGILVLLADRSEKLWTRMGTVLLAIWLVASGLMQLLHIRFDGSGVVLAVIALGAGVLILMRR